MKTWTDTHFTLDKNDSLIVCNHSEHSPKISLNLPGYCTDGRGFSIDFTTDHINTITKLLEELKALKHCIRFKLPTV